MWVRVLLSPHIFPKMKNILKKSEKYLAMSNLFLIFAIIIKKGIFLDFYEMKKFAIIQPTTSRPYNGNGQVVLLQSLSSEF